jgi:mRNA-degrading endonuclease RelE of RelBE toxin-antitoxin system
MSKQFFVEVEASLTFLSNLRKLAKKYRNIQQDIQPIIETLKQGQLLGEQIPGVKYSVFKIRVRNRDIQKGKSGGYRLIYYLIAVCGWVRYELRPFGKLSAGLRSALDP